MSIQKSENMLKKQIIKGRVQKNELMAAIPF